MKVINRQSRRWMAIRVLTLPVLLGTIGASLVYAETAVTDADVARATRLAPVISDDDIQKAQQTFPMPTDQELSRVPAPAAPRLEALPPTVTPSPGGEAARRSIDLEALAKGFEANQDKIAAAQGLLAGPALLVFVSFAMPDPTLQRLVDQAAKAQASLVIRGLVNGTIRDTAARVQKLIGKRRVGFLIDPQAFDRFGVAVAPTFVLVRENAKPLDCGAGQCYPNDAYVETAGDVSLDYALDYIVRAAPSFAEEAQRFLDKMRAASPIPHWGDKSPPGEGG